jgi:hypothetical protein
MRQLSIGKNAMDANDLPGLEAVRSNTPRPAALTDQDACLLSLRDSAVIG